MRRWLPLVLVCAACAPEGPTDVGDEAAESDDEALSKVPLRFDVATLNCASADASEVCAPDDEKCLCLSMFEALNYDSQRHFLAVGTEKRRAQVLAADNVQAVYVDDMNTGYGSMSGVARADALMAKTKLDFPTVVPKWFFINEISAGSWPDQAGYRSWVVAFAKRLSQHHGRSVIIAAPFRTPGHHADSWKALSSYAYVAAEVYLTGAEINKSGNSVAYARGKYQESIDAYARVGVPKSRLMLVEHFGNTAAGADWGRAGVSEAGWKNAIEARSTAAGDLGFAGFISYSWAGNQHGETQANRLEAIATYASQSLP
jgi:hypothetical protein